MLSGYEKVNLLHGPTPLEMLDNISRDLGINLYIKRDDLTPLAMGGNKLRKLEYLAKDALNQGATLLLTVGGAQTNHGRLTLAVARKLGLKGAIAAVDEYPGQLSANLLLDGIMGCDVWLKKPDGVHSQGRLLHETLAEVTAEYEAQGENVYFIPLGGSNELGCLGYYECACEMGAQAEALGLSRPKVVTTVGSLGTYMGLFLGISREKLPMSLTGIAISPNPAGARNYAKDFFDRCCSFFGFDDAYKDSFSAEDFHIDERYHRGAYNNPSEEVRKAMYYAAEKEALILDPCYTGKAFAGLLEQIKSGEISKGEDVIFLHTGGSPGITTPVHRLEIEREREKFIHVV